MYVSTCMHVYRTFMIVLQPIKENGFELMVVLKRVDNQQDMGPILLAVKVKVKVKVKVMVMVTFYEC